MQLLTETKMKSNSGLGFSARRVTARLGVLRAVPGAAAGRRQNQAPQEEEKQDLSANPLANVASRQPDKELFDKAMIALKKGRFDVAASICRPC
jgi:outer membrane protein assembly factor BamD